MEVKHLFYWDNWYQLAGTEKLAIFHETINIEVILLESISSRSVYRNYGLRAAKAESQAES